MARAQAAPYVPTRCAIVPTILEPSARALRRTRERSCHSMSASDASTSNSRLRYAVDETPSEGLTIGLSLQVVTPRADRDHSRPDHRAERGGPSRGGGMGGVRRAGRQRTLDDPAGPADGSGRRRLCPLHGHVRRLHRRVDGGRGHGRPAAARDARGGVGPGAVLLLRPPVVVPPAGHADGRRHGDHADRRQPVSDHHQHADGGSRRGSTPARRAGRWRPWRPSRPSPSSRSTLAARPACGRRSSAFWSGRSSPPRPACWTGRRC